MSTQELFEKASYLVKHAPAKESTNEEKLKVYGLFKQATVGDVEGSQPWAVQVEARAKWDAWAANKGMSKEDAQKKYVEHVAAGDAKWQEHEVLKNYSK
ncbi:Acyl-CoA-binding protein [Diplonema papillatum]|nr:Acyl-CoA-binding protein [Diplonema papillatum]